MYDSVYTEGTQPYQQPPIESEEGNVRKHVDGSFSVIEADGYVHNFGFNEQISFLDKNIQKKDLKIYLSSFMIRELFIFLKLKIC